ncbi:MAG: molybdopterin-guanine dinucleotide biosynthesis protein [Ignavibacteria bacterium]|nr:molybdopterin-guanine dinucleotide biosynthesis protein [Ignavibacteria bacterium]
MQWVLKVKYLHDYKLELEFNDGLVKSIDLSDVVGGTGIFAPLKNIDYFKKVSIDSCGNSICWENGADICPDVLYELKQ